MDTENKYRPIASKILKRNSGHEPPQVRVKKTKSRNGCIACKERRVKCSETKPVCSECRRRNLQCVYRTGIIGWKHFQEPQAGPHVHETKSTPNEPSESKPPTEPVTEIAVQRNGRDQNSAEKDKNHHDLMMIIDGNLGPGSQPASTGTISSSYDPATVDVDLDCIGEDRNYFSELLEGCFDLADGFNHPEDRMWDLNDPWLVAGSQDTFTLQATGSESRNAVCVAIAPPFHRDPHLEIGSSTILASLFRQKTCAVLSVSSDPNRNPWQTLIWPLAKQHSALDHAMAAMTCLQLGATHPHLRSQGQDHAISSIAQLELSQRDDTESLDVAIASNLALSMGKSWQHPRTSIGFKQIKEAGTLLRKVLLASDINALPASRKDRLRFLANTWMYMDVIARLDLSGHDDPLDLELEAAYSILNDGVHMLDPLMGCATTLFPMVGRLTDLLRRLWKDGSKQNSPIVVSQAVALQRNIEEWQPSMPSDIETEPSSLVLDSFQTAEAYRWASILLLYQAVPALPRFLSLEAVAEKILVFLATVLPTSGVIAVHIFPLLVAGSEIINEELRGWVRERWYLMSDRLITGVVDRCLEMTNEIWRRKDSQDKPEVRPSVVAPSDHACEESVSTGFVSLTELDLQERVLSTPDTASLHQKPFSFSKPVAGVSCQSGIKTAMGSVRDRLSWLKVMHDWNWHVMLG